MPLPAEPENQTRGLLLALLSLRLRCFPAWADVREESARAGFHGASPGYCSNWGLREEPRGGGRAESGQAGAERAVSQAKELGWLLRDTEPLEQLCDHDLTHPVGQETAHHGGQQGQPPGGYSRSLGEVVVAGPGFSWCLWGWGAKVTSPKGGRS